MVNQVYAGWGHERQRPTARQSIYHDGIFVSGLNPCTTKKEYMGKYWLSNYWMTVVWIHWLKRWMFVYNAYLLLVGHMG